MSYVLGNVDGERQSADTQMDVPTMMNVLMAVYNNVRDDHVMDEVAEAVGDAICMLGDMRKVAQKIADEDPSPLCDAAIDPTFFVRVPVSRKIC